MSIKDITAYQLQEHDAVFPRVIIRTDDLKAISNLSTRNKMIIDKYFLIDDDNKIFYDYLSYLRHESPLAGFYPGIVMSALCHAIALNFLNSSITENRVRDKYMWLMKYIFIWQLRNPEAFVDQRQYHFSFRCLENEEGISDYQSCMPLFLMKMLIRNGSSILLTQDEEFPDTNESNIQNLIDSIKAAFTSESVVLTPIRDDSFFNDFGLRFYSDPYEKRTIIEIANYVSYITDETEIIANSTYKWVDIASLPEGKRRICSVFSGEQSDLSYVFK